MSIVNNPAESSKSDVPSGASPKGHSEVSASGHDWQVKDAQEGKPRNEEGVAAKSLKDKGDADSKTIRFDKDVTVKEIGKTAVKEHTIDLVDESAGETLKPRRGLPEGILGRSDEKKSVRAQVGVGTPEKPMSIKQTRFDPGAMGLARGYNYEDLANMAIASLRQKKLDLTPQNLIKEMHQLNKERIEKYPVDVARQFFTKKDGSLPSKEGLKDELEVDVGDANVEFVKELSDPSVKVTDSFGSTEYTTDELREMHKHKDGSLPDDTELRTILEGKGSQVEFIEPKMVEKVVITSKLLADKVIDNPKNAQSFLDRIKPKNEMGPEVPKR